MFYCHEDYIIAEYFLAARFLKQKLYMYTSCNVQFSPIVSPPDPTRAGDETTFPQTNNVVPTPRAPRERVGSSSHKARGRGANAEVPRHQTRAISNTKLSLCVVGSRSEDERFQARGRPLPLAGHHHPARQDMENALLRR